MSGRQNIQSVKKVVIKIGSALLTNDGKGLDKASIADWVSQIAWLRDKGIDVLLVSSGSVAEGMNRLGWSKRPNSLHELQAAAAIGQMGLVQTYEAEFKRFGFHSAQILLVHEDLSDRKRYLNARNTMNTLLDLGVVPIINENDSVATDEIRFGDNDTLAAMVANIIDADLLVILTDQDGLYDADPRSNPSARLISEAEAGSEALYKMAGEGGALGRGGMVTKVKAAELAARSGTSTVIAGGRNKDIVSRLINGENIGSFLYTQKQPLEARKLWLAGLPESTGKLILDAGAVDVISKGGKSLLPVGISSVSGQFSVGEMVVCFSESGKPIAKGLTNYNHADAAKIAGKPSKSLQDLLGYSGEPEMIHCDNMILL